MLTLALLNAILHRLTWKNCLNITLLVR